MFWIILDYFAHNGKFADLGFAFLLCVFYTRLMKPNKVETGRGLLT